MDETELRVLGAELLTALPRQIPDPVEREPVAEKITAALAAPVGSGRLELLLALSAHEATRRWMYDRGAGGTDTVRGVGLSGDRTTPQGLYYVCPRKDYDTVLQTIPAAPPLCPNDGQPLDLRA